MPPPPPFTARTYLYCHHSNASQMPKYKTLKGFAHDISLQFGQSAEHFAWLAQAHKQATVTIDLLTGEILPSAFDIGRNRIIVDMCRDTLQRMQARENHPALQSVKLTARFPLTGAAEASFECTIVDDQGRPHSGTYAGLLIRMP